MENVPHVIFRNSLPEVFYKKSILENFVKLTGKHLYQSLFLNKVAGLRHTGSSTGVFLLVLRNL